MAVLPPVHGRAGTPRVALVPPLRPPRSERRGRLPRLSARADRVGAGGVRVPRSGQGGRPPSEVLRVARRGRGPRACPRGARPAGRRRRHMGSARPAAAGRARVRPGEGPRAGTRSGARPTVGGVRPAPERRRDPGTAGAGGAIRGDGRRLRSAPAPPISLHPAPGGRRADHRGDRSRLRGRAHRRRRGDDPPPDGLSVVLRSPSTTSGFAGARPGCLYSRSCSRPGLWLPGEPPR
jgi:hypothetical protein